MVKGVPLVRSAPRLEIDGLLLVDKEGGWTSHDVVARMRRLTGIRRIGHAGTLDPMATGLLPLGVGRGTRVLEYLSDAEKRYDATIRLGVSTDTYDAEGAVTATSDPSGITADDVNHALAAFRGQITQRPPAYSAIKRDGVPLHRLARAGHQVVASERVVVIHDLTITSLALPDIRISVRCSKGTYIRSLAHDLGVALGCGAHLCALRRTETGGLQLADALTLDCWEASFADGSCRERVLPLDAPLRHLPALHLDAASATRFCDGVPPLLPAPSKADNRLQRVYDDSGDLLGILRFDDDRAAWRVEKVLLSRLATSSEPPNS